MKVPKSEKNIHKNVVMESGVSDLTGDWITIICITDKEGKFISYKYNHNDETFKVYSFGESDNELYKLNLAEIALNEEVLRLKSIKDCNVPFQDIICFYLWSIYNCYQDLILETFDKIYQFSELRVFGMQPQGRGKRKKMMARQKCWVNRDWIY